MRDAEHEISTVNVTIAETPLVRGVFVAGGCRNEDIWVIVVVAVRDAFFAVEVVGLHERF